MARQGFMTHQEYEERYAEALEVVRSKFPNVGTPESTAAGTRFVRVNGTLHNDEDVFKIAWGFETARDIVSQRWVPRR